MLYLHPTCIKPWWSPSGRGFKWLQVNIGLICPASSASSKAKRIRSAFRTFCEYFLTFHAIYERRAMLSLASYEKDGRGKLERYGEKRLCLLLMCCWVHSWEQSKSRICKLYSDYSMPKSIHTVAMRRKVNKHYPQRKWQRVDDL